MMLGNKLSGELSAPLRRKLPQLPAIARASLSDTGATISICIGSAMVKLYGKYLKNSAIAVCASCHVIRTENTVIATVMRTTMLNLKIKTL